MIKLGIIGLSDGNGHPYSWSAIFNGYNPSIMQSCPYPVISEYLAQQSYPEDFINEAQVTHIWTQDSSISQQIALASNIENIVTDYSDMIGKVDAILLARDDSENHFNFAKPFLDAGLPIYIDKPIATTKMDLEKLFNSRKYSNQIFTCSALGYAKELLFKNQDLEDLGNIGYCSAVSCGAWEKYAVHIIEPTLKNLGDIGTIVDYKKCTYGSINRLTVLWTSNIVTDFLTYGKELQGPIEIQYFGSKSSKNTAFADTFGAFKSALQEFISTVKNKQYKPISDEFIARVVDLIALGTPTNIKYDKNIN